MKALAFLAMALLVAALPGNGRSHPFHKDAVVMFVGSAKEDPNALGERTLLWVHLVNGTGAAVTLRGLSLDGYGALGIERLRDFLIFQSWQQVDFIRLDPGEELFMSPPRYRISAPTTARASDGFKLVADFGPLGKIRPYKRGFYSGSDDAVSDDAVGQQ